MRCTSAGFKLGVVRVWSVAVLLYTSGHRKGWRHGLLHFLSCITISLVFGSLLFLGLRYSLNYDLVVCGPIAGGFVLLVTAALFSSKRVRCYALLFLVCCAMKQGRNFLLTAGTGLVLLWNVRNTFGNLHGMAKSMVCNLKMKSVSLGLSPISNYIRMIRWVGNMFSKLSEYGVVKFETKMSVWSRVESKELHGKLQQAEDTLNAIAEKVQAYFDMGLSIGHKVAPVLGIILVMVATALFLKKFVSNRKYKNVFITTRFVQYDEQQKTEGKPHVLPLTRKEAKRHIAIPSARTSLREARTMLKFFIPVVTYLLIWLFLIGLDWLLYWIILTINNHLQELEPFHVPLRMNVNEQYESLWSTPGESVGDFSYNVSLFEKECLPQPTMLLSNSLIPLSVIVVVLVIGGLLSAKLDQLKVLTSEQFYGDSANKRVQHLHAKIVRKKSKNRALKSTPLNFGKNIRFWFPIFFRMKEDSVQLA